WSESLVHLYLHGIEAVLIPNVADGEPWRYLVLDLDSLPRATGQVSGKGKEQIFGNALLHCKAPNPVALPAADLRIDGQRGYPRKFFHPVADLRSQLPGDDRLRRGGAGAGRFRRLTHGNKID